MKVKSESEVAQSYLTLSDPIDCGLPGSSVHGIFQARVLEWGVIAFSIFEGRIIVFLASLPQAPFCNCIAGLRNVNFTCGVDSDSE